jgi:hypothetical protein
MIADHINSPLFRLSEEDLSMICTFVLASGSVKDLAESYGVSYPTMRARLDGVIERLRTVVEGRPNDPLNDYLAELIAKGRIAPSDARKLRELHRAQSHDSVSSDSLSAQEKSS